MVGGRGSGGGGGLKCILLALNLCPRFCYYPNTKLFSSHSTHAISHSFIKLDDLFKLIMKRRLCNKSKNISSDKEYNILFKNYTLDIYNGVSQVYCIKPEGRIH